MIIYILLALILDKLSLFSGWIFAIWLIGLIFRVIAFIMDFIKLIIDIYKEI